MRRGGRDGRTGRREGGRDWEEGGREGGGRERGEREGNEEVREGGRGEREMREGGREGGRGLYNSKHHTVLLPLDTTSPLVCCVVARCLCPWSADWLRPLPTPSLTGSPC